MTNQDQLSPLFVWRKAITQSTLKATTRHVLLTLSLHMNAEGKSCFPSVRTVAEEAGLSRRAVGEHLTLAVNQGWIVRRIRGSRGHSWHAYEYELAFPIECEADADAVQRADEVPSTETTSTPSSDPVSPQDTVFHAETGVSQNGTTLSQNDPTMSQIGTTMSHHETKTCTTCYPDVHLTAYRGERGSH